MKNAERDKQEGQMRRSKERRDNELLFNKKIVNVVE